MRLRFILVMLVAALIALAGCGPTETERRLREADAMMESDPDSALAVLGGVDRLSLKGGDLAYYALLKTQGDVKTNVMVDSDSLISIAIDHYAGSKDEEKRKRACFYTAQVAFYRRDYPAAMRAVLPAYEYAKERNDHYWTAKSAELMADVFSNTYNYPQTEIYRKEAAENYQKAGKIRSHRFAMVDLATARMNNDEIIGGLMTLDSLYLICREEVSPDTLLIKAILSAADADLLYVDGFRQLKEAVILNAQESNNFENELYELESSIHIQDEGLSALIEHAMARANSESDSIRVLYMRYINAIETDDLKSSVVLADSLMEMQSDMARKALSQSVLNEKSKFFETQEKIKRGELKYEKAINLIIYVVVAAIFAILFIIMIWQRQRHSSLIDAKLALISSLESDFKRLSKESNLMDYRLKDNAAEISALHDEINDLRSREQTLSERNELLFRNRWKLLNTLCEQYYEMGNTSKERESIFKNIQTELNKATDRKNIAQIEDFVNMQNNDLMKKLRNECPFLKEDDFILLCLTYAGFSAKAICLFIGIRYKNYYMRKSRILQKISDSDAPGKVLFLSAGR